MKDLPRNYSFHKYCVIKIIITVNGYSANNHKQIEKNIYHKEKLIKPIMDVRHGH